MKYLLGFVFLTLAFTVGYFAHAFFSPIQVDTAKYGKLCSVKGSDWEGHSIGISDTVELRPESEQTNTDSKKDKLPLDALTARLQSLTHGDPKALLFSDIANLYIFIANLSESDITGFLRNLSVENAETNATALNILFSRYAEMNPLAAIEFAVTQVPNTSNKTAFLTVGLVSLAKQDPLAAYDNYLQISNTLPNQSSRDNYVLKGTLMTIFSSLAEQDMPLAIDKLRQMSQSSGQVLMPVYGITQALETQQDYTDLLTLTSKIDNHEIEQHIIAQWTRQNPEQVGEWLLNTYSDNRFDELKSSFISAWSQQNRNKSGDWLVAHSAPDKVAEDVVNFLRAWSWDNPEAAMTWLEQQPTNVYNQNVFSQFLGDVAFSQPQFTSRYLNFVDSEKQRSAIAFRIYQGLKRKSTSQAAEFLNQSDFKDDILSYQAKR